MKRVSGILLALVLAVSLGLVTATPVVAEPGTTYYVSTTGDDDIGDGTVGNPWRTIQEAVDHAGSGDTIVLAAGQYDAFVVQGKGNINIISTEGATVTTAVWVLDLHETMEGYDVWVMAAVNSSENINIEGVNFDGTAVSEDGWICGIAYCDSTGRIAGLTVENISDLELGAGVVIVDNVGTSAVEITGSTISNSKIGIFVISDSTQEAHFNNIVGNSDFGVMNAAEEPVDATYNWWGHASGPYHETLNPDGWGDEVSGNVDFEPWLGMETVTETVTNGIVDAKDEADTEVEVDGTATVTVFRYDENPGGDNPVGFNALGKWVDVYVPGTSQVTEIEIRLYYTDAELAAADVDDEEALQLLWWDGDEWQECSDGDVHTTSIDGYSGYIWAKIRGNTTPSLAQLQGTEFGGYEHPTTPPSGGCFIATAAYGTDTARELSILREFRDKMLLSNSLGAKLVSLYYTMSPSLASFISQHEALRAMVRIGFADPIVRILAWTHELWSTRGLQR